MKKWFRVGCVVKSKITSPRSPPAPGHPPGKLSFRGNGVITHVNSWMCTVRLLDIEYSCDNSRNSVINVHVDDLTTVEPGKSGSISWSSAAEKALVVGNEVDKELQGKLCVVANIDENNAIVVFEEEGRKLLGLWDLCAMASIVLVPLRHGGAAAATTSQEQLQEQLSRVYADMIELLEEEPMGNIFDAATGLTKNGFVMDSTTCGQEDGAYHVNHDLNGENNYCSIDEWNNCAQGWDELYQEYVKIQEQAEEMNITLDFGKEAVHVAATAKELTEDQKEECQEQLQVRLSEVYSSMVEVLEGTNIGEYDPSEPLDESGVSLLIAGGRETVHFDLDGEDDLYGFGGINVIQSGKICTVSTKPYARRRSRSGWKLSFVVNKKLPKKRVEE